MGFGVVPHKVGRACGERVGAAISQFGLEFAAQYVQDMALYAPMVGDVARGIVHPPDLDVAHSGAASQYDASLPWFGRRFYFVPLHGLERERIDLHATHSGGELVQPSMGFWR
jgi:hypothetical protein